MVGPIFSTGQRTDDYLIEKQLEKGRTAELFLATDLVLKRKVTIKVINARHGKRDLYRKRFLREARIQANLDNPHIVPIYRAFNYRNHICLVIQHIKGTDLAKVIKKAKNNRRMRGETGALSGERAIHIFLQVLEGIGFMHKFGIMHGDIKPSNILLDKEGTVKVADFGLSLHLSLGKKKKDELLGGTPYFMSPEQILKEQVDFRTDIYSLGATFFNMLTGEYPSGDRKKLLELLEFHMEGSLDDQKRILDEIGDIRPGIKEIILKAMEHDPNDRHQSCLEFSLAIKEEEPYEMYSELLRISVLTKDIITLAERNYLDKIALKRGLSMEDAEALEINIRKETRSSPLDFKKEYKVAYSDLIKMGRGKNKEYLANLEETYVKKDRISMKAARSISEGLMSGRG